MRVSVVVTVLNEAETIEKLLHSLAKQSKKPDEIIIVDGGSRDGTVPRIKDKELRIKNKGISLKTIIKKGNRAVGRNEAIKQAIGDIILSADAGCVLDRNWVRNIIVPFKDSKIAVVAGFYQGMPKNIFEKCLIPYVLVMPDKVDPKTFLPASRSMAFRKSVWEKAGGFPESFSHNEDYVFAQKLKKMKTKIVFAKDAIVYWLPRKNLVQAYNMFYRFALGDMEAGIIRPKVLLLFARYLFGMALLTAVFVTRSQFLLITCFLLLIAYTVWAIGKNYRYVSDYRAILFLPLIQLTADFAVILGSLYGIIMRRR